tara:strand:+ start:2985 stop:3311 length:327 start_codon:yes stop_codon:yes gene_type:complete
MDTIADYVSNLDEIAELKKQNRRLIKSNSQLKIRYEKVKQANLYFKSSRTSRAEVILSDWMNGDTSLGISDINGKKCLGFKDIAKMCFLSEAGVKTIYHKLKNAEANK